uniref:[RNA-polymerase]-subunit kinase n=1 Tax=Oryza brachyantha TaxID=4533 RepID=J3N0Z8_ORYBR
MKIMEQGDKLDLLLKRVDEAKQKRLDSEAQNRAEIQSIKRAIESRLPEIEKRVEGLNYVVIGLQAKVEGLEKHPTDFAKNPLEWLWQSGMTSTGSSNPYTYPSSKFMPAGIPVNVSRTLHTAYSSVRTGSGTATSASAGVGSDEGGVGGVGGDVGGGSGLGWWQAGWGLRRGVASNPRWRCHRQGDGGRDGVSELGVVEASRRQGWAASRGNGVGGVGAADECWERGRGQGCRALVPQQPVLMPDLKQSRLLRTGLLETMVTSSSTAPTNEILSPWADLARGERSVVYPVRYDIDLMIKKSAFKQYTLKEPYDMRGDGGYIGEVMGSPLGDEVDASGVVTLDAFGGDKVEEPTTFYWKLEVPDQIKELLDQYADIFAKPTGLPPVSYSGQEKDGTWRMVVDYRKLNEQTVKRLPAAFLAAMNDTLHPVLRKCALVLYGHSPGHFGISSRDCSIPDLDEWLKYRNLMQQLIQQHLHRAQQQIKYYADKKRSFREFAMGDWVYLKIQPYVQTSVANRANHKLAFKYFGPYQILDRGAKGFPVNAISPLPAAEVVPPYPLQILDSRLSQKDNRVTSQIQVQWSNNNSVDATWEDEVELRSHFPGAPAWGQASFQEKGIVRDEQAVAGDELQDNATTSQRLCRIRISCYWCDQGSHYCGKSGNRILRRGVVCWFTFMYADDLEVNIGNRVMTRPREKLRVKRWRYNLGSTDDYERLDVVGQGAFGVVVRVQVLQDHGKNIALKRLLGTDDGAHFTPDFDALRVKAACQHACRSHPSIVEIKNIVADGKTGEIFVVMEFVGSSLREEIPRARLEDLIREMMWQLVTPAKKVHDSQVIHRDIKSENILISVVGHMISILKPIPMKVSFLLNEVPHKQI